MSDFKAKTHQIRFRLGLCPPQNSTQIYAYGVCVRACVRVCICLSVSVWPLKRLELSTRKTHSMADWQLIGMQWPWGLEVKGQGHGVIMGVCTSIWLCVNWLQTDRLKRVLQKGEFISQLNFTSLHSSREWLRPSWPWLRPIRQLPCLSVRLVTSCQCRHFCPCWLYGQLRSDWSQP